MSNLTIHSNPVPRECSPYLRLVAWLVLMAPLEAAETPAAATADRPVVRETASQDTEKTEADKPPADEGGAAEAAAEELPFYIRQYRIKGTSKLPRIDVEAAVYPFMGPECTSVHVKAAMAALQKAYHDKGYQTVSVNLGALDQRQLRHGIVVLEVTEGRVGRLRVRGSRYFSLDKIKKKIPSLAEGEVPDFNQVQKELVSLNRFPDRQVLLDGKKIKPGAVPGTFDVELTVKDKLPLHASLELNNRYSPDTTQLRVNSSLSYTNLWQAGHTAGFSFQIAPERPEDATVYSAFYLMPVPDVDWLSFMLTGTKQDSDVSTLGGAAVAGRGYMAGLRANVTLPQGESYFHTLSAGFDFKHFDEDLTTAGVVRSAPIEYWPVTLGYNGTYDAKTHSTDINASLVMHPRGAGNTEIEFDAKRFKASGNFFYFRGDVAHTHDLPGGMEIFGRIQGQAADQPLVNSEQFAGGGLGSARGYLESTVLGDNALFGTLELRSPSLISRRVTEKEEEATGELPDEWRVYLFADAGVLTLREPLPEQQSNFRVASVGAGTRFKLRNHLHGSLDAGFPLIDAGTVSEGDWLLTFRLWADF